MAFSINPVVAKSGEEIVAKGSGAKRRQARIRVDGTLVLQFTMPGNGRFTQNIIVPTRDNGLYPVVLQQLGLDNVWRQTASTSLTINNPVVEPPPPPPPPPPSTPTVITDKISYRSGETINVTVSGGASNVEEWVALYTSTGLDENWSFQENWKYLNGQKIAPTSPVPYPANVSFVAPSTAGTYNIRYFASEAIPLVRLDVSPDFTVIVPTPTPTVPPAPNGLSVIAGDKQASATWGAISLATYKVYRNDVLIASPTTTTFTDTGLTNGVQYSYKVSAVNAVGEGPKAGPVLATPTSSVLNSRLVTSISALKTALLDNTLDEIVVQNGTYACAGAGFQQSNSLYIGAAYASRTRPITIKAQTSGGVTFSGSGGVMNIICFVGGAHHQTWDGFKFADATATETGIVVYGGPNQAGLTTGPHHITMRNITFTNTLHGYAYNPARSNVNDHCVYFSDSIGTATHDILMENVTVQGATTAPIHSAFHWYTHGFGIGEKGSYNVTMRNWTIDGVNTGVIFWDDLSYNLTVEDITISNSKMLAIRYEEGKVGANNILRNVTTTNSGLIVNAGMGFYSSQGSNPPGLTFDNCNFDGVLKG